MTNSEREKEKEQFSFIENPEKINLLQTINEKLNINKHPNKKIVFVYSAPKVGSTSIISSLRIFGLDKLIIIHIHDEIMLYVLTGLKGVTINEIILYNKHLGRDVFVIDIYREPIERKISAYFEKIGAYHFNNTDVIMNTYNVNKVIKRFNRILPHISVGDHFMDTYNISYPEQFDFENKYLLIEQNGVKYIKLRLKDSEIWGNILTVIFGFTIRTIKDYESTNKPIKDLYSAFKHNYRIPLNLLTDIMQCKYLNYYLSKSELEEYFGKWSQISCEKWDAFTVEQYLLYDEITIENSHIDYVQTNHYMDDGCICKACVFKRAEIAHKLNQGRTLSANDRINHEDAKNELLTKQVNHINRLNIAIQNKQNQPTPGKRKDFKRDMQTIVNGRNK